MTEVKKAFVWSVMDTYLIYGIKFVFALAIARILSPHDYGLVAYTTIFMTVAGYFSGVGFEVALVQKKEPTETDYATGFYFNLICNFVFTIIYFFLAGPIAEYFREPDLKLIFRVASLNLLFGALFSVHYIKLTKLLKFKQHALVNFFSSLGGSIIGLVWAIVYQNYWALVFQTLSGTFFKMVGYWFLTGWKPILAYSWESWRNQFKFGSKVFVQGIIETFSRESYTYFIGKFHSTEYLGFYNRTVQFYNLFIVQLSMSFNKVLYPTMAQYVVDDVERQRVYHKTYLTLFAIFTPLSLYFYLNAQHIVVILLSNKWVSVIAYLKILFMAGFISSLTYFNSTTVLAANKAGRFLKLEILNKSILFIGLLLTFKLSVGYILYGWLFAQYFIYFLSEIIMRALGYVDNTKYFKMLIIITAVIPTIPVHYYLNQYSRNLYLTASVELIFLISTYTIFLKLTLNEVFLTFLSFLKLKKGNA